MSDKKLDFDSLDFSEITSPPTEEQKAPTVEKVPIVEKKPISDYGVWVFGKDIEEVTPEEMKKWIFSLTGIEPDERAVSSAKKRSVLIDKVIWIHSTLQFLGITQAFNKDTTIYQN